MNKRRLMMLLMLPVVLAVLLGGAKWKQMHPTPTRLDLQERAYLRKAVLVNVSVDGKYIPIPTDEFKRALEDFYILQSVLATSDPQDATIVARRDKSKSQPLGRIEIGGVNGNSRYSSPDRIPSPMKLHPTTQRRLRELVAKHTPAN